MMLQRVLTAAILIVVPVLTVADSPLAAPDRARPSRVMGERAADPVEAEAAAIGYLVRRQYEDGSWHCGDFPPLPVTSIVLIAISGKTGDSQATERGSAALASSRSMGDRTPFVELLADVVRQEPKTSAEYRAKINRRLLDEQNRDGSWGEKSASRDENVLPTSYAILTLRIVNADPATRPAR